MEGSRLTTMITTTNRSSMTALKASLQQMLSTVIESQRNLSRTLLPAVQKCMSITYNSSLDSPRGPGTFLHIKGAMPLYYQKAVLWSPEWYAKWGCGVDSGSSKNDFGIIWSSSISSNECEIQAPFCTRNHRKRSKRKTKSAPKGASISEEKVESDKDESVELPAAKRKRVNRSDERRQERTNSSEQLTNDSSSSSPYEEDMKRDLPRLLTN